MSWVLEQIDAGVDDPGQFLGYGKGWLMANLPVAMQEDELLGRVLSVFETIAATVRFAVDGIDHAADLTITGPSMLRYLGAWVDATGLDPLLPTAHQRRIVRAAGSALRRRGTAFGLQAVLEALTGTTVRVTDSGGVFRDALVVDRAPRVIVQVAAPAPGTEPTLSDPHLIEIVLAEVPVHVHVTIRVGARTIHDGAPIRPGVVLVREEAQ